MKALTPILLLLAACATSTSTPTGPIRSKDGMPVVHIPAGEFICGDKTGFGEPERHVEKIGEYWIDKYEVSNAQFAKFLNAQTADVEKLIDRSVRGLVQDGKRWSAEPGRENHPASAATWHGASAYAAWVGGRIPNGLEWEKAARGPDGRRFPWGDEHPDATLCNYLPTGLDDTAPVGSYPKGASPYGVMDMAGNVYERITGPRGPGGIRSSAFCCPMGWQNRASDRCGYSPNSSNLAIGFRCVMDAPPK